MNDEQLEDLEPQEATEAFALLLQEAGISMECMRLRETTDPVKYQTPVVFMNFEVTILNKAKEFVTTRYSAGEGHAYTKENGHKKVSTHWGDFRERMARHRELSRRRFRPAIVDVVSCLVTDLSYETIEDFEEMEYGAMDCLTMAAKELNPKVRAVLGHELVAKLQILALQL